MKIHNFLTLFHDCIRRWEKLPDPDDFVESYYRTLLPLTSGILFDDHTAPLGTDFYSVLLDLNWKQYRQQSLELDPVREEIRLRRHLKDVESLFGFELQGEIVLFSSFACMDGYARFDRGTHRVFLGVDESHARGTYLDVLTTHELTHVARESRPEVWTQLGLDPRMTHDQFTEHQPVIEHLMGEGFSCAVSEILVPEQDIWSYTYQTQDALTSVLKHSSAVNQTIHRELSFSDADGDYGRLYNPSIYRAPVPQYSHYVWAWQWVKQLIRDRGGSVEDAARHLIGVCSRDFESNAKAFKLGKIQ